VTGAGVDRFGLAAVALARAEVEEQRVGSDGGDVVDRRVDDEVARAARDAGLSLAFVTRNQLVEHGDDRMHLRRVNIHEQVTASNAELLCLLLGVF
jgi:hypothetical protein